ncbi:MAG TPA: DeoR/GlpR family DNA-binding transcription regulator [Roseiflexaceae bacterium]|jgi:DeoR/GlpR family transcriptional regulator of sugar metabolism|nr:DeoR/GlpR family DNA-binding transcription regulator [Roseiflexaceae bacterium]
MDLERRDSLDGRRELILAYLAEHDRVSVSELSHALSVSEVTVRKDLDALESQGLLTRVHGGAIGSGRGRLELHFAAREEQQRDAKRRIAMAAAALIRPHQRLFLDASTTALQVARLIKTQHDLFVVTNGLYTALELTFSPGITTLVVGGRMRQRSSSLVGAAGQAMLERLRVDIGFFGAAGVTAADGLMERDLEEAQLKQWMVKSAAMAVGVVDSTKFGTTQLHAFALPHELDRVITDQSAPADIVEALRRQDVLVELV